MMFQSKLDAIIQRNNSLVCVGLDADRTKISTDQFSFNKTIIDATHDLVCAYKPNSAFYENGNIDQLKKTCDYLKSTYPEIPIILDAKRGDIGHANIGYIEYAYDFLGVDAITLHPYLGQDALQPFLDRKDKGCIILCRTSNPGAGEFQNLPVEGKPLYQIVAERVMHWNTNNNCLLVVGATYAEELAEVRKIIGDMTMLVPGIGAQGGDVKKILKAGLNSKKAGMIINSSRAILYSEDPREEARRLREQINAFR
jgi:orotidine-5'-phosphate decarboxylase